jgi:hypothetical protein
VSETLIAASLVSVCAVVGTAPPPPNPSSTSAWPGNPAPPFPTLKYVDDRRCAGF